MCCGGFSGRPAGEYFKIDKEQLSFKLPFFTIMLSELVAVITPSCPVTCGGTSYRRTKRSKDAENCEYHQSISLNSCNSKYFQYRRNQI